MGVSRIGMHDSIDLRAARGLCAMLVCGVTGSGHHAIADRQTWRYCRNARSERDDLLCDGHWRMWRGIERGDNK